MAHDYSGAAKQPVRSKLNTQNIQHKSNGLKKPSNIHITHIPPYTPEMNPIEQIWAELRKRGFKNEIFGTLTDVVDRLCETINGLTAETIQSITGRKWITAII